MHTSDLWKGVRVSEQRRFVHILIFMLYKALLSDEILGWHCSYCASQEVGLRSYFSCLPALHLTELWVRVISEVVRVRGFWIVNSSPNLVRFWNINSTQRFEKYGFLILLWKGLEGTLISLSLNGNYFNFCHGKKKVISMLQWRL